MKPSNAMLILSYLVYIILWEGLIFGGAGWAVFVHGHSGWWILGALVVGGCAYRPAAWHELLTGRKFNDE